MRLIRDRMQAMCQEKEKNPHNTHKQTQCIPSCNAAKENNEKKKQGRLWERKSVFKMASGGLVCKENNSWAMGES